MTQMTDDMRLLIDRAYEQGFEDGYQFAKGLDSIKDMQ